MKDRKDFNVVSHLPAYDVIGTWTGSYLGSQPNRLATAVAKDGMKMNIANLKKALQDAKVEKPDLIFVIRPGNPASCGALERRMEGIDRTLYRAWHSAGE